MSAVEGDEGRLIESDEGWRVDTRQTWDVLGMGDLVQVALVFQQEPGKHPITDDGRLWTDTLLDVAEARQMALDLQEMCRLIEEGEALGTND